MEAHDYARSLFIIHKTPGHLSHEHPQSYPLPVSQPTPSVYGDINRLLRPHPKRHRRIDTASL
jgi:hypothetical protein